MENSKVQSRVWIMLCVVCTVLTFTVLIALSIGITEPVEQIRIGDARAEETAADLREKTFLGHPATEHPKYECEDCLDLNTPEVLDSLTKGGL